MRTPQQTTKEEPENAHESVSVAPADNVYAFVMFTLPLENAKYGRITWKSMLASGLAMVSLIFQAIILYAVFQAVVLDDVSWKESIMGPSVVLELPLLSSTSTDKGCNTGGSLCKKLPDGNFSCAPPSVQLTGRWDVLDVNGDGVWTKAEAEKSREKITCEFAVNPVEVFDVFVKFLLARKQFIWIHPELEAGNEIDKTYFTYAKGDLIMCGYRDEKMCANLLERGFFDSPLKDENVPRVGATIDSALDYCYALLEPGGTCERTLPSTYSVWKKSSVDQCLGTDFEKYVYTHPRTGTEKSMLTVDYAAAQDYGRASANWLFITFKTIVILLFFLALWSDMKDIFACFLWVMKFPSASQFNGEEVSKTVNEESGESAYEIQAISGGHRFITCVFVILRLVMNIILLVIGETFLQKDTDWVNLLLNGVALVFILDIASALYGQLVDSDSKEHHESIAPMRVDMPGLLSQPPALRDICGFIGVSLVMILCMYLHYHTVGSPLHSALQCACLSEGDSCFEAHNFDKSFWDNYWSVETPRVFKELDQMKAEGGGDMNMAPAPAPGMAVMSGFGGDAVTTFAAHDKRMRTVTHRRHPHHVVEVVGQNSDDSPVSLHHHQRHHPSTHHEHYSFLGKNNSERLYVPSDTDAARVNATARRERLRDAIIEKQALLAKQLAEFDASSAQNASLNATT